MVGKVGDDISVRILGDPEVKSALDKHVPELEALKRSGLLENLRLVRASIEEGFNFLTYEGRAATPEFYADPVQALVNAGVIQAAVHEPWIGDYPSKKGMPDEYRNLEFRVGNLELQIEILSPVIRAGQQ